MVASAAIDAERKVALAQFTVKINGAEASEAFTNDIVEVVVDERLHAPAMFEIRLFDHEMYWLDQNSSQKQPKLEEGMEIEIVGGFGEQAASLCVGKVTSIEADISDTAPTLVLRGYDKSFQLHRNVQNRTFLQVTDADLANKVAGEVGLTPQVDATTAVHPYVIQYNETNYQFLQRRAMRIGYELRVDGKKLIFAKPKSAGAPIPLELGINLSRFRPQLSVAEQVDEVTVRGWDPGTKQEIVGTATRGESVSKNGVSKPAGSAARSVWGEAKRVIVDVPVETQDEATTIATAVLDDLTADYVRAEGETSDNPKLRVGATVDVKRVGNRFSGQYYLTAVTHRFDKAAGHQIEFTASTRRPTTLTGLVAATEERRRPDAVVVGLVTNLDDPEKLGRVKVKFPWFSDENESHWARIAMPMAGNGRGFITVPEVNDEVLLAFEHGDPTRPFVIGALWNGKDKVPAGPGGEIVDASKGVVNLRYWQSRSGHVIAFDDTQAEEKILIVDKTGKNHIKILSKDNKLEVHMEGDIQVTSGKNISVKAKDNVAIEAENGKVAITAKTNFEVDSGQVSKVKAGSNFEVDASANATMKAKANVEVESGAVTKHKAGANYEVAASASATMKANANVEVTSMGQLKLSATGNGELSSLGALKVSGVGTTSVESGGNLDVKSGANLGLQSGVNLGVQSGAMVNITGGGMVNVTAPLIKLN